MPGFHRGGGHGGSGYRKPYTPPTLAQEEARIRTPRPGEIMGIVTGLVGGGRMMVHCEDGKERLARVPGKIRNKIWVRENDYVLIKPWPVEGDSKCDIAFRYTSFQAEILKRKGIIKM